MTEERCPLEIGTSPGDDAARTFRDASVACYAGVCTNRVRKGQPRLTFYAVWGLASEKASMHDWVHVFIVHDLEITSANAHS